MARIIRLAARTIEPFHLESPKFLTSLLCLLDTWWRNVRQIDLPGRCYSHFRTRGHENKGCEHFYFCLEWLKFVGGYNLGSGKQLLTIKGSFRISKPGFRGLMSELMTSKFPSQKADLYDVISLEIEQLFT